MKKIYVGNLPYTVSEDDLRDKFSEFGTIEAVDLIKDRFSGKSKGFAFITFETEGAAESAKQLNGQDYGGRNLTVNEARERTGGGGGYR